jgi:hypothetical protein
MTLELGKNKIVSVSLNIATLLVNQSISTQIAIVWTDSAQVPAWLLSYLSLSSEQAAWKIFMSFGRQSEERQMLFKLL